MDTIESIKIDLSRKEDDLTGQATISCIDGEIILLDLDGNTAWIVIASLQNLVASEIKRYRKEYY